MPTLRLVAETARAERQVGEWDLDALRAWFADPTPLASLDRAGAAALLRDLAFALRELCAGHRQRVVVPTEAAAPSSTQRLRKGAVWELGLERDADRLLVSLFRQGTDPEVLQTERAVSLEEARRDLLSALGDFPVGDRGLALAREALLAVGPASRTDGKTTWRKRVHVESTRRSKLVLGADVELRRPMQAAPSEVARADLHALLFLGDLHLSVGSSCRTLRGVHVFLVAELMTQLAREALEAHAGRRGMLRRVSVAGTCCGVLLDADGDLAVTLEHDDQTLRMAAVPCPDFARAVVSFCRRLAKQVMVADRGQKSNLRLTSFRRDVRGLVERLRGVSDLTQAASKINRRSRELPRLRGDRQPRAAVGGAHRSLDGQAALHRELARRRSGHRSSVAVSGGRSADRHRQPRGRLHRAHLRASALDPPQPSFGVDHDAGRLGAPGRRWPARRPRSERW